MSTRRMGIVAFTWLLACGGHGPESTDVKPAEECLAYAQDLQACFAEIGAPARPLDQLSAYAASPRDEAARSEMNETCARERAQLRTSCK